METPDTGGFPMPSTRNQPRQDPIATRKRSANSIGGSGFSVTGPAGAGKSTELAHLAMRLPDPVVLLRGSAMTLDERDVGDCVANALSGAARDLDPSSDFSASLGRAVAAALQSSGHPLVVILDALNESPLAEGGAAFDEWIVRTESWLSDTGARLILSSRPTFWSLARDYFTTRSGSAEAGSNATLDEFAPDEFAQALRAFGIAASPAAQPLPRLPLMLRLYADVSDSAATSRPVRVHDLLDAYVEDRSREVARRLTPPTAARWVRERLIRLASVMSAAGGSEASATDLEAAASNGLVHTR